MLKARLVVAVALLFVAASSSYAVTYIVPSDRDLVRGAEAIVIATGVSSYSHYTADGRLVTTADLTIDRAIKGDFQRGDRLQLSELGGRVGDRGLNIPGSPRYDAGSRYLIFIATNKWGEHVTAGMGLGRFAFVDDEPGVKLLSRAAGGEEIFGFDASGAPYRESLRDREKFLQFVAAVVAGQPAEINYRVENDRTSHAVVAEAVRRRPIANFTRGSYLLDGNPRWPSPPSVAFQTYGTQSGFSNGGRDATATALGMWTGAGVGVNYSLGGTLPFPNPVPSGLAGPMNDGVNSVLFNDPHNLVAGFGAGVAAIGGTWTGGPFPLGGETFATIGEGDVEVSKTLSIPEALFAAVMTHELGHTLGFRHANQKGDSSTPCDTSTMDCASVGQAIMASTVVSGLNSLQAWDLRCIQTVYGTGPVCNAPTSVSVSANPTSITSGGSSTLTATASGGSSPYNYIWYQGNPPNTSSPVPGGANTNGSVSVSPTATTNYWAQATATCGGATTNSAATMVTVTPCVPITGLTASANPMSIVSGSSTTLSASISAGSGVTYSWSTSGGQFVGSGQQITVFPSQPTTYIVTATNSCTGSSPTASVTVAVVSNCVAISGLTAAANPATISVGQQSAISASVVAGTGVTFSWSTTGGQFVGNGSPLNVSPISTTTYVVTASNTCTSQSPTASTTVTVGAPCSTTLSALTNSKPSPAPGESFTLTAPATTTSGTLSFEWYRGALNDTSSGILSTTSTLTTSQTAVSQTYWVKAKSTCGGNQPTGQITVSLKTGQCGTNVNQLCVNGARYRITLSARDQNGKVGQGVALYQSDVFGYFSLPDFSTPQDPQVFVKVVGPLGTTPLIFYSGLTNLQYTLTVVDTQTGQTSATILVPAQPGTTKNLGNFDFAGAGTSELCRDVTVQSAQGSAGSCVASTNTLCLLGNRFRITLDAGDNPSRSNRTGPGVAVPANDVFGFFTVPTLSSDPTDIQAFVKMIDATGPFGKFWVFLGGLTDFRLTITVTDTRNGAQKIYTKAPGSLCGINDIDAFNP